MICPKCSSIMWRNSASDYETNKTTWHCTHCSEEVIEDDEYKEEEKEKS